jgi:hypothetical protein
MDAVVVASDRQVCTRLHEEVLVLDLSEGVYYSLNRVGAQIWESIQEPRSLREIHAELLRRYPDVPPERCGADLVRLLEDLVSYGLVTVTPAAP